MCVFMCRAVASTYVHYRKTVSRYSKENPSSVFIVYVITRMLTLNKLLSGVIIILPRCRLHVKLETIQQLII